MKKKVIWLSIILAVTVLSAVFFFDRLSYKGIFSGKLGYAIPGVPHYGSLNSKSESDYILTNSFSCAVASVMDYWNPGKNSHTTIVVNFFKMSSEPPVEMIRHYLDYSQKGLYDVREEHLEINELKKYVNPQSKTPLIFFNPISDNVPPALYYRPFYVLIGVNELERKVIFHDFWLGSNKEVSFDEFKRRWDSMRPDERNKYIVIQPVNLEEKLKEIGSRPISPYPKETLVIQKSEEMLKNEAIGQGFFYSMNYAEANDYLLKVINHPDFSKYLPPYFQITCLDSLAVIRMMERNFPEALDFANRALALDHDLDKPLDNGWPGMAVPSLQRSVYASKTGEPSRVLGDIYWAMRDFERARENYKKALDDNYFFNSMKSNIIQNLKETEKALLKNK